MSEEEAEELIKSQPPNPVSLSAAESRRLKEAYLVKRGDLSEDEIRAELEVEHGPLD
jgi:hypothetical protein